MSETKKPLRRKEAAAVETGPGAWGRFERAVDTLVRTPPKPRKASGGKKAKPKPKKSKPK